MQSNFRFGAERFGSRHKSWVTIGASRVSLHFIRHRLARRYVLRLRLDGSARVTIPRGGSTVEATRFVHKNIAWLERQLLFRTKHARRSQRWQYGTEILFRGQHVRLEPIENGEARWIHFATEMIQLDDETDLRPAIERHLRRLATRELPARLQEFAALHQLPVRRVSVRNQRSRWGSCSQRGTVSLNWRLIQTPDFVRDYILLHELAHLREMNHSLRFWRVVARLCPDFAEAEKWLKNHAALLG